MFGRRRVPLTAKFAATMLSVLISISLACGSDGEPPAPSVRPTPASTPTELTHVPTIKPLDSPTNTPITPVVLSDQSPSLILEVTSPPGDLAVFDSVINVAGTTTPDATLSVNGVLAPPDAQGLFSLDLPMSSGENPLSIEVIATSISGEKLSVVRSVIFIP